MHLRPVDIFWASFFGLPPADFLAAGVQVVPHHELKGYEGAWLFRRNGVSSCIISVPPRLVEPVRTAVASRNAEDLFCRETATGLFGSQGARVIGPAYQGFVEEENFLPAAGRARALGSQDAAALRRLADACGQEAWDDAGIAPGQPNTFGCFAGAGEEELAAVARFRVTEQEAAAAWIGVVTHPEHRGKGYGRTAVSVATEQGLRRSLLLLYQTLLANAPSVALASRLGYRQYATHFAVRFWGGA